MTFYARNSLSGCVVGVDGSLSWPKGEKGDLGKTPDPRKEYTINYCGLPFKVWILPDTYASFEDVVSGVTGDELEFLKVVNQQDYEEIREEWAKEYRRQESFRAFERGVYESDR